MEKIAVGPEAVGSIDITATPSQNLRWIAKAKRENVRDLTVVILDRPRHARADRRGPGQGARIRLITDGDVYGAIAAGSANSGVDVLMGIGGTPEGVIAAAALEVHGRRDAGPAVAPGRRRARGHPLGRPRSGRRARRWTIWCAATTASSPPPASPTDRSSTACASTRGRDHPEPRHAQPQRHRPPHRRPPPAGEAPGVLRRRLFIVPLRSLAGARPLAVRRSGGAQLMIRRSLAGGDRPTPAPALAASAGER